ncbi:MAG: tRNA uridine(34) 5-carboxymethylaminomethyl modification radical SAM/GNAT enzyme Elp3 [Sulfolobales archaeon]|nr:tRNA uridine(34) 5-carboxymethylaminomethyl modification radical SAM/GNAT enzyme Elp3 [Sulfolobales archaeon]MCX8208080.1 tRNA uridine(34) 5-carboxymethylaminomethyl modification radical SAM/GNAT enzyme Elp3 [Sulfolobales archaeon]MDW8010342.1 tRNA uridine(34) 5-carboxymethylaminomethyl modification radical SAM/GNAT enzyme Elp3 [Sulfolobales archaeon]
MSAVRLEKVRKPTRMLSGVSVVAVMTKPHPCPHGKCVYCPGGPDFGTPQSYIGEEPALMRALRVNFDPYQQVRARLAQYELLGQVPSKVEVVVMGGTFMALPEGYQEWFIANVFHAANRYPERKSSETPSLQEAQKLNEVAKIRIVGLTIETRPDFAKEKHADRMLYLGATRVEVGVQTVFDDVLALVRRGHTVRDTVEATRVLKDSGFKVVYHVMPGLPGSDPDRDIQMVRELFENPDFRPDMLKIYPTVVVRGTELYNWWIEGRYRPYTDEEAIELISETYKYVPKWVRVMRIQRDIPVQYIEAGPRKGNLRELVELRAIDKGIDIREIRFREVGRQEFYRGVEPSDLSIKREHYEASRGMEVFLSVEDPSSRVVVGILRLRIPSEKAHRPELKDRSAIIRELHVYGPEVPVGIRDENSWQHRGWGARLLREAEDVARYEFSCRRVFVLPGVGAREYYRKHGYRKIESGPYMVKELAS